MGAGQRGRESKERCGLLESAAWRIQPKTYAYDEYGDGIDDSAPMGEGASRSLAARLLHLCQQSYHARDSAVAYAPGDPCMVGPFAYGGAQEAKVASGVLQRGERRDSVLNECKFSSAARPVCGCV